MTRPKRPAEIDPGELARAMRRSQAERDRPLTARECIVGIVVSSLISLAIILAIVIGW